MCRASCAVRSCACTTQSHGVEGGSRLTAAGWEQELPFQLAPPVTSDEAAHRKCDMLSTAPVIPELSAPSAEALAMSSIWCRVRVPVTTQSQLCPSARYKFRSLILGTCLFDSSERFNKPGLSVLPVPSLSSVFPLSTWHYFACLGKLQDTTCILPFFFLLLLLSLTL